MQRKSLSSNWAKNGFLLVQFAFLFASREHETWPSINNRDSQFSFLFFIVVPLTFFCGKMLPLRGDLFRSSELIMWCGGSNLRSWNSRNLGGAREDASNYHFPIYLPAQYSWIDNMQVYNMNTRIHKLLFKWKLKLSYKLNLCDKWILRVCRMLHRFGCP